MNTDNLRVKWIEVEASVWEAQQAELKALREENDRLKERELDQIAGIEGLNALIATLESQLAELRQGGEDFRSCSCTDGQTVCKHIAGSPACSYEHPLISAIPPLAARATSTRASSPAPGPSADCPFDPLTISRSNQ